MAEALARPLQPSVELMVPEPIEQVEVLPQGERKPKAALENGPYRNL